MGFATAMSIKNIIDETIVYIISPIWVNILISCFLQFLKTAQVMTNDSTYINSLKDAMHISKRPCNIHHIVAKYRIT